VTTATDPPTPVDEPSGPAIDWGAALARHDRWLRTVVFARVGERQAVEEVMQEVSLAAVAQRAPIADPGKVGAWLYRLAVRQTLLYRRGRGRQRKLVGRFATRGGGESGEVSDPLGWLLADERARLVRSALGRLNRRDAEILMLKYTEGWTYRDLAAHLGASEAAVEARLHRARLRLRAELSGMFPSEAPR